MMIGTKFFISVLLVSLLFVPTVFAGFFGRTSAVATQAIVAKPRGVNYHRLHESLSIGDNPNEDIRANVFLNMEGL